MSDTTMIRGDSEDAPSFSPDTLDAVAAGIAPSDMRRPGTRDPAGDRACFGDLYGNSPVMQNLFSLLARVAPANAVVLVTGESGTGKELVATTLHKLSPLSRKPFVPVNCGAFPPNMVEAELFGHERGGFTGAVRMRKGCFERADGGTLFLDEITEMPPDMQVKLLRVLETGRFCRVGGDEEIEVRVRVVAATNRCPGVAARAGALRQDLLYRLSVFPLDIPALRERGNDIELLAGLFLDRLNTEGNTAKTYSQASTEFLHAYRWPGNVRELKNLVQRAYLIADDTLELAVALAMSESSPPGGEEDRIMVPLGSSLADTERHLIRATLDQCGGNKTRTAQILGVSLKTLYNRLHEYGGIARRQTGFGT